MRLQLKRTFKGAEYTIGHLYVDGKYLCDTLEDPDRGLVKTMPLSILKGKKVHGKTAIPAGTYHVTLDIVSPRFAQFKYRNQYGFCDGKLPRLCDVPCYDGVLMHIGNSAEDTEGCILVGLNKAKGKVLESTATFRRLYDLLARARGRNEEIFIEIS